MPLVTKTLLVAEIFYSLQGESSRAGLPCVFVRLSGCDLRCTYCDAPHALQRGRKWTIGRIVKEVQKHPHALVEITGGEPLLQPNVYDCMKLLCDKGRTVLLETSGAHDISRCDPRIIRIMDIKCPSSGQAMKNRWQNILLLTNTDEVKFVVASRQDFAWAIHVINQFHLLDRCSVLVSAVTKELPLNKLAKWVMQSKLSIRLQPQLHKIAKIP